MTRASSNDSNAQRRSRDTRTATRLPQLQRAIDSAVRAGFDKRDAEQIASLTAPTWYRTPEDSRAIYRVQWVPDGWSVDMDPDRLGYSGWATPSFVIWRQDKGDLTGQADVALRHVILEASFVHRGVPGVNLVLGRTADPEDISAPYLARGRYPFVDAYSVIGLGRAERGSRVSSVKVIDVGPSLSNARWFCTSAHVLDVRVGKRADVPTFGPGTVLRLIGVHVERHASGALDFFAEQVEVRRSDD